MKNWEREATVQFTLKVKTGEKEAPQVLEPLKSITVRKTETVVLSTTIAGNPATMISWFKNGKPIKKPTPKKDGDTYSITIVNTTMEDTAEYTVKAKNSVGTAGTTAQLTVEEFLDNAEPPLFVERFEEQTVQEEDTIRLLARVVVNPVPEVHWLRNNKPLKPSDRIKISYDGENIELTIKRTDTDTDTGDYKCVASNPAGKASHGAKITVDADVTFTKKLKKSYETTETETIEFECETSHKTTETKWYHKDVEISGMDHRVVIQDGRTHKLIVKKTTKRGEGRYKCTIKKEKTETVLKVKETKPKFIRELQDLEIPEKWVAVLEVEVSSDAADVTWFKDGSTIKETDTKYVIKKEKGVRKLLIRITFIHDEGEYSCTLLDQESKAEVTVIELPPEIITPLQDKMVIKGENIVFEIELHKGNELVRWLKDGTKIHLSEHVQIIEGEGEILDQKYITENLKKT